MTIKLKPGLLVALSTRVDGGISYAKEDLGTEMVGGTEVKKWKTTKVTADPEEYAAAVSCRLKVRGLVKGVCAWTPFMLICLKENVAKLDAALAEADAVVGDFNATAKTYKVRYGVMRGEVAESTAEAVHAVRQEISGLLADMDLALKAGEVKTVRDLTQRAAQMERLLEAKTEGRDTLSKAISAARRCARAVVKRVQKQGEDAQAVLAEMNLAPIAQARFVFDEDFSEDEPAVAPAAEPTEPTEPEPDDDAMPAVALAGFASLADLPADGDEETTQTLFPVGVSPAVPQEDAP